MPKTSKKKPVKKAKPLIEGKYSHKFLTRLEPTDGQNLEQLQKQFGQKTLNGTIKRLINDFQKLSYENYKITKELGKVKIQSSKQAEILMSLRDALSELQSISLVEPDKETDDDYLLES